MVLCYVKQEAVVVLFRAMLISIYLCYVSPYHMMSEYIVTCHILLHYTGQVWLAECASRNGHDRKLCRQWQLCLAMPVVPSSFRTVTTDNPVQSS